MGTLIKGTIVVAYVGIHAIVFAWAYHERKYRREYRKAYPNI